MYECTNCGAKSESSEGWDITTDPDMNNTTFYLCPRCVEGLCQHREPAWSLEWPTEGGLYWLYAKVFGRSKYCLEVAEIFSTQNSFVGCVGGSFLFKHDIEGQAYWMPIELPSLPEIPEEKK